VLTDQVGFAFPVNHFMFKAYNNKIVQMIEGGLIEFFSEQAMNSVRQIHNLKHSWMVITAKIDVALGLDHIGIWFLICAFLLGFATLSFFVELKAPTIGESVVNTFQKVRR
jgi:hypothetical protein